MHGEGTPGWTNVVMRATVTLLIVAVAAKIAWQLLNRVLPALIVVAVLVIVYRLVLGVFRRDRW